MAHLTDEQIDHLASISEDEGIFNHDELIMMEHLKTCSTCYDQYCIALALAEVTSEAGYAVLSDIFNIQDIRVPVANKVLAVINLIKKTVANYSDTILEQIENTTSAFSFQPTFAMGTRGADDPQSTTIKIEDINDEKTFISLDPESKRMIIQINTKDIDSDNISVSFIAEDGTKEDILMERKGKILKGVIENFNFRNGKIMIESDVTE